MSYFNLEGWMFLVNKWILLLFMCEYKLCVCFYEVVKVLLKGEWFNKDKFIWMSLVERVEEIVFRKLFVCGDKMEFILICVCFYNGCFDVYYIFVFFDEESVC